MQMMREAFKNSPDTSMKNIDDKQLEEVILASSKEVAGSFLLGHDNAIAGIGFAQFVLDGRIDNDIRGLAITTTERQLLPLLISRYDGNYHDKREQQLIKCLKYLAKQILSTFQLKQQLTSGLAKWGRTEAVSQHLYYYVASYRADGILSSFSS